MELTTDTASSDIPQGVAVEMVKGTETFRVDVHGATKARAHCVHFPTDRWTLVVGGAWGGIFSRADVLAHMATIALEGACRPLAHYRKSAGTAR